MKEVKCILNLSRKSDFKEEFTYLRPKKIKPNNNKNDNNDTEVIRKYCDQLENNNNNKVEMKDKIQK